MPAPCVRPSPSSGNSVVAAVQLYEEVLEPFTRNRKSTKDQRAVALEQWSNLIRRTTSKRYVYFSNTNSSSDVGGSEVPDLLLAKSARSVASGGAQLEHSRLLMVVRYLRFATLRKVVDNVLVPSNMSVAKKKNAMRSLLHAAADVCALLPTEDSRVAGLRRGIPWGSLDEGLSSSDEDRDDGAPRPLDDILRTAAELIVVNWDLICPVPRSAPVPPTQAENYSVASSPTLNLFPSSSAWVDCGAGERTPSFQDVATFCEEVKLMLLRFLRYKHQDTFGTSIALALCLTRTLVHWNDLVRHHTADVQVPIDAPEARQVFEGILFFRESFTAKADGAHLQSWAQAEHLSPGVRVLHTSLLLRSMRCGIYQHHASSASGLVKTPPTSEPSSPTAELFQTRSSRMTTLEVLMEAFEWFLAGGGPTCATRYLHMFPSRYGEDSGFYRSATELRIVAEAELHASEVRARCVLLCQEFQDRRDIGVHCISGHEVAVYPHCAAVLPDNMAGDALRYDTRKKIASLLQSLCPDRYPIRESIILPDDVPDVEALEVLREQHAAHETDLLRVARLEVHERLEWERLEEHGVMRLGSMWTTNVASIFAAKREELMRTETAVRLCEESLAPELLERFRIERDYVNIIDSSLRPDFQVDRMRCRVREREQRDLRFVSETVVTLESDARSYVLDEEAAAEFSLLLAQESLLRHVNIQSADDTMLHVWAPRWVETQAAVAMDWTSQHEVRERSLLIRWMIMSLSRAITRPGRARGAGSNFPRRYLDVFLHELLMQRCAASLLQADRSEASLTIAKVWRWFQLRVDEVHSLAVAEQQQREELLGQCNSAHGAFVNDHLPALKRTLVAASECRDRKKIALACGVEHVQLAEYSSRLCIMGQVETQRMVDIEGTAAYDAIALFGSICGRMLTLTQSTEPSRRASTVDTEALCRHRLTSEFQKSWRAVYQRKRPSESQYIGPERGLAPRPPADSSACASDGPHAIAAPVPHMVMFDSGCTELGMHFICKSPSRTCSTPGLSTHRDVLSSEPHPMSGRLSDLDVRGTSCSRTHRSPSRASSASEWNNPFRRFYTPQPPSERPCAGSMPATPSTSHTTIVPPLHRVVVDVPHRPTSARPVYKLISRSAAVDPPTYQADTVVQCFDPF